MALEEIQQHDDAFIAVHPEVNRLQLGKGPFVDTDWLAADQFRLHIALGFMQTQFVDDGIVDRQRLRAKRDHPQHPPRGTQRAPVVSKRQLDKQIAGEERLTDNHPPPPHDAFARKLRPIAGVPLPRQVLFCPLVLPGFALDQIPSFHRKLHKSTLFHP
ncbi:hypothetical protein D3C86_1763700 [compost metagenome]